MPDVSPHQYLSRLRSSATFTQWSSRIMLSLLPSSPHRIHQAVRVNLHNKSIGGNLTSKGTLSRRFQGVIYSGWRNATTCDPRIRSSNQSNVSISTWAALRQSGHLTRFFLGLNGYTEPCDQWQCLFLGVSPVGSGSEKTLHFLLPVDHGT